MALSLCDHADVEAGIKEFRRSELSQSENRSIEVEITMARYLGVGSALGGCDGETRPSLAASKLLADVAVGHAR
jgi:hypothetical protein